MKQVYNNVRHITFWLLVALWAGLTFSNAIVEITFTAALIFWLAYIYREQKGPHIHLNRSVLTVLVVFLSVVIASHFWSEATQESFRGIFKILQQLMLFVMVAEFGPKRMGKYEKWFLIVLAVTVANGFFQYFSGHDFFRGSELVGASAGPRVSAGFKTYSQLAAFLILSIPYAFSLGLREAPKSRKRYLIWALCLLGLIALYLTRSRGAALAFVMAIFLILLVRRKFRWVAFLVALSGATLLILPHSMIIHLDADNREQSIVERLHLWDRAFQVIEARPLTGTGINTYLATYAKYDQTDSWRVRDYYAHNSYLQMAAEIGIPGLLVFLTLLACIYGWSRNKISEKTLAGREEIPYLGLVTGTSSFLFFAFVDTGFHSPVTAMMFWYLLGIQVAYVREISGKNDKDSAA